MIQILVWNGELPAHAQDQLPVDMEPVLIARNHNGIVQEAAVHTAVTMIQAVVADIPATPLAAMIMMYGI
jgi:hypothetical protein